MKKELSEKQFFKRICLFIPGLLLLVFLFVYIIDPFYHYHAPIGFLKAYINQAEYQGIGSVRNFSYDAILLGSSMAENYNNRWFNEDFGVTLEKGIKSSGHTADLLYILNESYKNHELKYVFYSLDPFALMEDAESDYTQYLSGALPLYLYDDNPFNDVQYIYNKDVLFSAVPTAILKSLDDTVDEGETYSWYQTKEFSSEAAIRNTVVPAKDRSDTPLPIDDIEDNLYKNVSNIFEVVNNHPETRFIFFIPPYSKLYWENIAKEGKLLQFEYAIQYFSDTSLNATPDNYVYYNFLDASDITENLDNYMDSMHFSMQISLFLEKELANPKSQYRISGIR